MTIIVITAIALLTTITTYSAHLRRGPDAPPAAVIAGLAAVVALAGIIIAGPPGALITTSITGLTVLADIARRLRAVDRFMAGRR